MDTLSRKKVELTTHSSKELIIVLFKPIAIVFICFFSLGASIAVVPIYINTDLQFGSFIIGVIIALQYLSTLLSRTFVGNIADSIGTKITVLLGILAAITCGMMYLGYAIAQHKSTKLFFIVLGRIILGISESLTVTGSLTWALNRVRSVHAGKVMAWNGNAMYGGIALGAFVGGWLSKQGGFLWVAYAAIILPIIALAIAQTLQVQIISAEKRLSFYKVTRCIVLPGIGLLLSTVGYGVIISFLGLLFQERHWIGAEIGITYFGVSYVLARLFFSGMPDRFGGARVALLSLTIECIGQILIFFACSKNMVFLGTLISGFGFSLAVPSFGIEAIKRIPMQNRGTAVGIFLAFFDLSFCIAVPLAGAVAKGAGYCIVYFFGFISAFIGGLIALKLLFSDLNSQK